MPPLPQWPYLTAEIDALPGRIKVRPEDFVVEELAQYPCLGQGDHMYFLVEKSGMTTLDLIRRLARALGRRDNEFGYAGLKDSQAVTRQFVSLEHIEPDTVTGLSIPDVKILSVDRHKNKLKLGHLAGNAFIIKIRDVPDVDEQVSRSCLDMLLRRGVPNYFGVQRFGVRGDNWIMGRAIMTGDHREFLAQFCGRPTEVDNDLVRRAREFFDREQYELAGEVWPGFFRDARRVCRSLMARPTDYRRAFRTVDRKLKRLFVSAYQSYLFNRVLARRVDGLDRLVAGDLAYKHVNGAVFAVDDPPVEQGRADAFEISPSGPLFGYRMSLPQGEPGTVESGILDEEGLTLDDFRKPEGHKIKGSRRPLRVPITDLDVDRGSDEHGRYLRLQFKMPSGAYATAVLRELMKDHLLATHHSDGSHDV